MCAAQRACALSVSPKASERALSAATSELADTNERTAFMRDHLRAARAELDSTQARVRA